MGITLSNHCPNHVDNQAFTLSLSDIMMPPIRVCYKRGNIVMKELLATNNMVTLSVIQSLLDEAGFDCLILDQNMSILEGSLGIIPRRVMVADDHFEDARQLVVDAGFSKELKD